MNDVQLGSQIMIAFPTILIFEMLLLLPVRSLLRFRCICKEWCELIDSRLFRDTYLAIRRALDVDDKIVGLNRLCIEYMDPDDDDDDYCGRIFKYSLTCWYDDYESLAGSGASALSSSTDNFQIPGNYPDGIRIVGHVNGVVCLIHGNTEFHSTQVYPAGILDGENWFDVRLVNPALGEMRKLPDPVFHLLGFCSKINLGGYITHKIGFGYDDVRDDYKVVVIVNVFNFNNNYNKYIGMVYYLSTNSWKILGDMSQFVSRPLFECQRSKESVFSHGSIHWCLSPLSDSNDDGTFDYSILVFNVTDELFREMPFPQHGWVSYSIFTDCLRSPHLFLIDKSTLALVCNTRTRPMYHPPGFEVWVMNDYGNPDSWTKHFSIDEMYEAVFFWKKDKLFISTEDSDLICYDLSNGRQWDLVEPGFEIWRLEFVTGHESLVSVKQV